MQDKIRMNGIEIWQPDTGLKYPFETTYSEDSGRVISGVGHFTPLFTVWQLGYTATDIPVSEASKILQIIIRGHNFTLHYFDLLQVKWMDAEFYVGKGDCTIGELVENNEYLDSLSFSMTGVNPL